MCIEELVTELTWHLERCQVMKMDESGGPVCHVTKDLVGRLLMTGETDLFAAPGTSVPCFGLEVE